MWFWVVLLGGRCSCAGSCPVSCQMDIRNAEQSETGRSFPAHQSRSGSSLHCGCCRDYCLRKTTKCFLIMIIKGFKGHKILSSRTIWSTCTHPRMYKHPHIPVHHTQFAVVARYHEWCREFKLMFWGMVFFGGMGVDFVLDCLSSFSLRLHLKEQVNDEY